MTRFTPSASEVLTTPPTGSDAPARPSRVTGGVAEELCGISEYGGTGQLTTQPAQEDLLQRRVTKHGAPGQINPALVKQAADLVDSMDIDDDVTLRLCLQDLASIIARMWEDGLRCSQPHLDILATLERAVREARGGSVTRQQVSAFREALADLAQSYLTPVHADVIRSRFLDAGFGPLSFLDLGNEESSE